MDIYSNQINSHPLTFFTQHHSSTYVHTFIQELYTFLGKRHQLTIPLQIESNLEIFKLVKQYYVTILNDPNWLPKLLYNSKIPIRKGVLIFTENARQNFEIIKSIEIDSTDQQLLYENLEKIRTTQVRVGFCKHNLGNRIKSLGVGCVIHMEFPLTSNEIDVLEYKSRVQRAYTPNYIGVSIAAIRNDQIPWVTSCSSKLGVQIERLFLD